MLAKIIDFLLYSNIWIGGTAAALYFYSKYLLTEDLTFDLVGLFVFLTCVWLYSLHRYIGFQKVNTIHKESRFYKIRQYQKPIGLLAILSFTASLPLIFIFTWEQIFVLSLIHI